MALPILQTNPMGMRRQHVLAKASEPTSRCKHRPAHQIQVTAGQTGTQTFREDRRRISREVGRWTHKKMRKQQVSFGFLLNPVEGSVNGSWLIELRRHYAHRGALFMTGTPRVRRERRPDLAEHGSGSAASPGQQPFAPAEPLFD